MPVPSAEQATTVVFLNRKAGGMLGGADLGATVQAAFARHARPVEIVWLDTTIDFDAIVSEASRCGQCVVAGGGDGTINTVAARLVGTSVPLGVLPLGTLNHFAKDLGIPAGLDEAVDVIAAGHILAVDVGQVNDHLFLNNCSVGFYPTVVKSREAQQRRGRRKWLAAVLAGFKTMQWHPRLHVTLDADGSRQRVRTPFVMIANNEYNEAGMRLSGRQHLGAGRLFAYVAPQVAARDLPWTLLKEVFLRIFRRQRSPSAAIVVVPGREMVLDLRGSRKVDVAIDGEVIHETLPLHLRSRPAALRVCAPGPAV